MLKYTLPPLDRRRARSAASRQKIAEAAEQLVLEHGRAGLTTSALTRAAGLSERTVFNHFKKLEGALAFRIAQYLEPMIDQPPFPTGLKIHQVPSAITDHFHAAVDTPEVQQNFARFMLLASALSEEEFDGIAQEVLLTLSDVCDRFCRGVDATYPQLTTEQSLANGLYTISLLMGVTLAFLARAQQLDHEPGKLPHGPEAFDPAALLPLVHKNIDQVAGGTPVYSTDS